MISSEIKDGKFVITHSSGHIDQYDIKDIDYWLNLAKERQAMVAQRVADLTARLAQMKDSLKV
jgi:hypothetical protein